MELTNFTESLRMNQLRALKEKLRMYTELNNEFPNNERFKQELKKYKTYAKKEGLKVD